MIPRRLSRPGADGFTLLEVMVVIVIIAVVVGLAVISLGDNAANRLDEESRRLRTLIRLAADEAVLQGYEIGIAVQTDGYEFQVYDDLSRQWSRMADDRMFRPRKMPDGISMELFLDDQELVLPVADDEQADDTLLPQPQLLLLSSGEMTPFELELELELADRRILLRGLPNGTLEEVRGER